MFTVTHSSCSHVTIQRCNIYYPLTFHTHALTGSPPRQRGQQSGEGLDWIAPFCMNTHQNDDNMPEICFHGEWHKHQRDRALVCDTQSSALVCTCCFVVCLTVAVRACCSGCWVDRVSVWDVSIGHSAERSSVSRHTRFWKQLSSQWLLLMSTDELPVLLGACTMKQDLGLVMKRQVKTWVCSATMVVVQFSLTTISVETYAVTLV